MKYADPTDPILKETMPPYEGEYNTSFLKTLVGEMFNMMRDGRELGEDGRRVRGIGLAAPQVGSRLNLFIMHMLPHKGRFKDLGYVCINPTWQPHPDATQAPCEEGCLTWPGRTLPIYRYSRIVAEYNDIKGVRQKEEMAALKAQCFQHETDHLRGVTIF